MRNLKRIIREVLSESDYTVEPELGTFPREKEVKSKKNAKCLIKVINKS